MLKHQLPDLGIPVRLKDGNGIILHFAISQSIFDLIPFLSILAVSRSNDINQPSLIPFWFEVEIGLLRKGG